MSVWAEMAGSTYAIRFADAGDICANCLEAGGSKALAVIVIHGTDGCHEPIDRNPGLTVENVCANGANAVLLNSAALHSS